MEKFGTTKTVDLKENGRNVLVTDMNKLEYVQLVCKEKLTESIKEQVSLIQNKSNNLASELYDILFYTHQL